MNTLVELRPVTAVLVGSIGAIPRGCYRCVWVAHTSAGSKRPASSWELKYVDRFCKVHRRMLRISDECHGSTGRPEPATGGWGAPARRAA